MTVSEKIWIATIEQEIGDPTIVPATTRGVARKEAERITSEVMDDPIQNWVEDWADGTSECGFMESGRWAIISRRNLISEDTHDKTGEGE